MFSTGLKHKYQFNDLTDVGDRKAFAEKLGEVISLEGIPVHP